MLQSSFEFGKDDVLMTLSSLFSAAELTFESERALEVALQLFRKGSADFADCLHVALATQAGKNVAQMAAIKTHNPFALNDIVFARATGCKLETMNNFGCSLVWGHPQAPMGTRAIIEVIEELALRGGGWGLFTGCAAGDTAMAVVLEVTGA